MNQKFYADPRTARTEPNGAISFSPSNHPSNCLGRFAKIRNCPIAGTGKRLTCYATGYADTWFSIPAVTRYRGNRVVGYFSYEETGPEFHPMGRHKHLFEGEPE